MRIRELHLFENDSDLDTNNIEYLNWEANLNHSPPDIQNQKNRKKAIYKELDEQFSGQLSVSEKKLITYYILKDPKVAYDCLLPMLGPKGNVHDLMYIPDSNFVNFLALKACEHYGIKVTNHFDLEDPFHNLLENDLNKEDVLFLNFTTRSNMTSEEKRFIDHMTRLFDTKLNFYYPNLEKSKKNKIIFYIINYGNYETLVDEEPLYNERNRITHVEYNVNIKYFKELVSDALNRYNIEYTPPTQYPDENENDEPWPEPGYEQEPDPFYESLNEEDLSPNDVKFLNFMVRHKTPKDFTYRHQELLDEFLYDNYNFSPVVSGKIEKYMAVAANHSRLFVDEFFTDLGDQSYIDKEYATELVEDACNFFNITTEGDPILRIV